MKEERVEPGSEAASENGFDKSEVKIKSASIEPSNEKPVGIKEERKSKSLERKKRKKRSLSNSRSVYTHFEK